MTYQEGLTLLRQHIRNENLVKHCIAAGIIMRALAKRFGDNEEIWELAGLLHDIDWEETQDTPERHSLVGAEYLAQAGLPSEVVEAVRVHNHAHGFEPRTLLEKSLYCAEELTGLIVACALVQPDKKLSSVKPESILKKFKVLSFAKGVNREVILRCKEFLGMELEELVRVELGAMQERSLEVGL